MQIELEEWLRSRKGKIEGDPRYIIKNVTVEENAGLALIQLALKEEMRIILKIEELLKS